MRRKHTRRNDSGHNLSEHLESLRKVVAYNLRIDPDRIRYGNLGHRGRLYTPDPHWQIYYRGEWRELPWTYDGPMGVTRETVKRWYPD